MRIAQLVESLDLPQTEVAERAWDDGRRRVRRRRGAIAAGGAALSVVCVVVAISLASRPDDAVTPSPAPSPSHPTAPHTPVLQNLLMGGRWRAELADLDYGRFSGSFDHAVALSSDPVGRAVLASSDPRDKASAFVLGQDGAWRRVDVEGLVPVQDAGGYTTCVVRPTSLSPDANRLALPQPGALVVVDLGDGTSRRYDVPGLNAYAIWADATHVLVAAETDKHGTLVDLDDGSFEPSAYGPSTAFLGDTTLTWAWDRQPLSSVLRWGDGRRIRTDADNEAGFFPEPPLVKDDVVIGFGGPADGGYPNTTGFQAVDGTTGRMLAYLPVTSGEAGTALLMGWDGDRAVVGIPLLKEMNGLFVFAWDWRDGELEPIGHVVDWTSWGTGRLRE